MSVFDDIRKDLNVYLKEMGNIRNNFDKSIDSAKDMYLPAVLKEKEQDIRNTFKTESNSIRSEHLNTLNGILKSVKHNEKSLFSKDINFELLNKLNIISQAGIELTEEEIRTLSEEAMKSGSSIVMRKVLDMANKSGYDVQIPNEQLAIDAVNEAVKKVADFINNYDGSVAITGQDSGDSINYKMMASLRFIDEYESKYNKYNTSDFRIESSLTEAEKSILNAALYGVNTADIPDKIKELSTISGIGGIINRSQYKEYLIPKNLKIDVNKIVNNDDSAAANYAKEYSERMNPTNSR